MEAYSPSITKLIEEFQKLPGIGAKTAQRLAFYVLNLPEEKALEFANAITEAKSNTKYCSICFNLTDTDPCKLCTSPNRDPSVICVVEWPKDVMVMERTKEFKGYYHVLHGAISPMANIGPNDIKLKELLTRLKDDRIKEVIVATNPTVEGEATATYISRLLAQTGILVTRLANGVPVGGDLEYADEATLAKALQGRTKI